MGRNNDAVVALADDIEEVNMDDRLVGKLQSDVEHIKSDVSEMKRDIREVKKDVGELKQDVGELKMGLQQVDAKLDRTADSLRSHIELELEKMRGGHRTAFIAIVVLLVLTLASSAPGAIAALLKLF